jgi:alpha-galactosidase
MLEVGVRLSHLESQTHFAMWAVISSPLILGFDMTDTATVESVWDVIANKAVLGVSQTWAGHPGRLVANSTTYFSAKVPHGATAGW